MTTMQEREVDAPDVGQLVRRAAEGDQWAWERLVDRYARLIWAITREFKRVEGDAADVALVGDVGREHLEHDREAASRGGCDRIRGRARRIRHRGGDPERFEYLLGFDFRERGAILRRRAADYLLNIAVVHCIVTCSKGRILRKRAAAGCSPSPTSESGEGHAMPIAPTTSDC